MNEDEEIILEYNEDKTHRQLVDERIAWQKKHKKPWYLSSVKGLNKLKL